MIKRETCVLDELGKQRLQRHIQKLASAAQRSFAKKALLQEQADFLSQINREVKACRSTLSVILGRAKVMSYEDLEEARKKRAAKEETNANTNKKYRGRKRKTLASKVRSQTESVDTVAQVSPAQKPTADLIQSCRAPAAQMY